MEDTWLARSCARGSTGRIWKRQRKVRLRDPAAMSAKRSLEGSVKGAGGSARQVVVSLPSGQV